MIHSNYQIAFVDAAKFKQHHEVITKTLPMRSHVSSCLHVCRVSSEIIAIGATH